MLIFASDYFESLFNILHLLLHLRLLSLNISIIPKFQMQRIQCLCSMQQEFLWLQLFLLLPCLRLRTGSQNTNEYKIKIKFSHVVSFAEQQVKAVVKRLEEVVDFRWNRHRSRWSTRVCWFIANFEVPSLRHPVREVRRKSWKPFVKLCRQWIVMLLSGSTIVRLFTVWASFVVFLENWSGVILRYWSTVKQSAGHESVSTSICMKKRTV